MSNINGHEQHEMEAQYWATSVRLLNSLIGFILWMTGFVVGWCCAAAFDRFLVP